MGGAFTTIIGSVAVLLVVDEARIRFKVWAPQAGLVLEHFGEMIFGMEFEKPKSIETGKLIPVKYEKPAKALDLTKTLSEQTPEPPANFSPPPPIPTSEDTEQEISAVLETSAEPETIAGLEASAEPETLTEPSASAETETSAATTEQVNYTPPPPPLPATSEIDEAAQLKIRNEERISELADRLEKLAQEFWTVLPQITNDQDDSKPESSSPEGEIPQPEKPVISVDSEEASKELTSKEKAVRVVPDPHILKSASRLK